MRLAIGEQVRESAALRESFFSLAHSTFEIEFFPWHAGGFWGERYVPYSLIEGDRVVANISVNVLDVLLDGTPRRYVQLGTVMTDLAFWRRGLSRRLMEKILADWRDNCDMIYLYANDTVLDFYPKFGFERATEHAQTLRLCPSLGDFAQDGRTEKQNLPGAALCTDFSPPGCCKQEGLPASVAIGDFVPPDCGQREGSLVSAAIGDFAPLDLSKTENLALFSRLYRQNNPFSRLVMRDNFGLVMFYCGSVFKDSVFYSKKRDAICIAFQEGETLQCLDIFCAPGQQLREILSEVTAPGTTTVQLGFSAKGEDNFSPILNGDALYVLAGKDNLFAQQKIRMPLLSHA